MFLTWILRKCPRYTQIGYMVVFMVIYYFITFIGSSKDLVNSVDQNSLGDDERQRAIRQPPVQETRGGSPRNHAPYSSQYSSSHGAQVNNSNTCQVIHLAMMYSGDDNTRHAVEAIKHVLYFKTSPLHIHIMSDARGCHVMKTLFDTWELPQVSFTTYDTKTSDMTASLNLIHLRLLPKTITHVIYLDTSVRLMIDISELWSEMTTLGNHVVAIPDITIFGKTQKPTDPVSGIALYNMPKLRDIGETSILNIVDIHMLDCSWHIHPNWKNSEVCLGINPAKTLIILPRSHHSFSDVLQLDNQLELLHQIRTYDGDLFRRDVRLNPECPNGNVFQARLEHTGDDCREYRYNAEMSRRLHLYYYKYGKHEYTSDGPNDISITTQFTIDRFESFTRFMVHWDGPVHAVVYATDEEAHKLVQLIVKSNIKTRRNIAYHIVFKRKRYYPINLLRNIALEQVQTPYNVFIDVDLVCTPGMYAALKNNYIPKYMKNTQNTLVLPAFDALEPLAEYPQNKTQLLDLMSKKIVYGYKMWRKWNHGHKPTNYPKWKTATEPYKIEYVGAYEPYVVLPTNNMPKYDNRLLERMGDKIYYGQAVNTTGYKFIVVHDLYVIHLPHARSAGTNIWSSEPKYFNCGAKLFKEAIRELKKAWHTDKSGGDSLPLDVSDNRTPAIDIYNIGKS